MNEVIEKLLVEVFNKPLYLLMLIVLFVILTYLSIEKIKSLRKVLLGIILIILLYFGVSLVPINKDNIYFVIGGAILFAVIFTIGFYFINKKLFKNNTITKNKESSKRVKQSKKIIKNQSKKNADTYFDSSKVKEVDPKMCPECGGELVLKEGKYGKFYGCTSYPDCNYIKKLTKAEQNILSHSENTKNDNSKKENNEEKKEFNKNKEDLNICPECGNKLVERKGKYGTFFGCSNYPSCKYIKK